MYFRIFVSNIFLADEACDSQFSLGIRKDGPGLVKNHRVFCHFDEQSGWIIIQKRTTGVEPFNRSYGEYHNGFGDHAGEHWLGNEILFDLTSEGIWTLRFLLTDSQDRQGIAQYEGFQVGSDASSHPLTFTAFSSGTIGDSLVNMNGNSFKAVGFGSTCAEIYGGFWWGSLTCPPLPDVVVNGKTTDLIWKSWTTNGPLKETMMIMARSLP